MAENNKKKAKVAKVCKALERRNMKAFYVGTGKEACAIVEKILEKEKPSSIGVFGSSTLREIGLIENLKKKGFNLIDPYEKGVTNDEVFKRKNDSFCAECVLTGTNAITEEGQLVNIDGLGNRAAAMIYGPKKVIVVTGVNKIVKDIKTAFKRIKQKAAPKNNIRLGYNNPCVKEGHCVECNKTNDKSICRFSVVIERQKFANRMNVIIIGKELGY